MLAAGCGGGAGSTMDSSTLLARVRAAYVHVPAVTIVNADLRYTFLLRHGLVAVEKDVMPGPDLGPPQLIISYPNGRGYASHNKARCWVPDPPTSQSDPELGKRFPHLGSQVGTPRRAGRLWQLPVIGSDGNTAFTLLIDAKTLLIKRLVFAGDRGRFGEEYKTLRQAPTFPTPRPLCPK